MGTIILGAVIGGVLATFGISFIDWQFYAILVPLIVVFERIRTYI